MINTNLQRTLLKEILIKNVSELPYPSYQSLWFSCKGSLTLHSVQT